MPLFETVTDLIEGAETLRRRPLWRHRGRRPAGSAACGCVRFRGSSLSPKSYFWGGCITGRRSGDRIRDLLQPALPIPQLSCVALRGLGAGATTMATLCRALAVLDEITRLKRSDAILCEVANWRISTEFDGPMGLGAALSLALAPALHQAILRRIRC